MNAAYNDSDDAGSDQARRGRRVRFELIFASVWLAIGLFVLPGAIYLVGAALLGPYGDKAGLSTFYIDFFGDLSDGSGRAWALALGPVVLVYLIRVIFLGVNANKPSGDDTTAFDDEPPRKPERRAPAVRREVKEPQKELQREPRLAKETKRSTSRTSRVEPRVGN